MFLRSDSLQKTDCLETAGCFHLDSFESITLEKYLPTAPQKHREKKQDRNMQLSISPCVCLFPHIDHSLFGLDHVGYHPICDHQQDEVLRAICNLCCTAGECTHTHMHAHVPMLTFCQCIWVTEMRENKAYNCWFHTLFHVIYGDSGLPYKVN